MGMMAVCAVLVQLWCSGFVHRVFSVKALALIAAGAVKIAAEVYQDRNAFRDLQVTFIQCTVRLSCAG